MRPAGQLLLDLPDEADGDPLLELIHWCVQVQDFNYLQTATHHKYNYQHQSI